MTTLSTHPSAVIYDFASKARAIRAARGQMAKFAEPAVQPLPTIDYGSGWYHQAAIQEADRTRKQ